MSRYGRGDRRLIYIAAEDCWTGYFKVGRSRSPGTRMRELATGNPRALRILAQFDEEWPWREGDIHKALRRLGLQESGEWFLWTKGEDALRALVSLLEWRVDRDSFDLTARQVILWGGRSSPAHRPAPIVDDLWTLAARYQVAPAKEIA